MLANLKPATPNMAMRITTRVDGKGKGKSKREIKGKQQQLNRSLTSLGIQDRCEQQHETAHKTRRVSTGPGKGEGTPSL